MGELISLKNVSKSFKDEEVVKSCTISFEEGCIYGIIGRNGSGKSVLLKLICGLYQPDEGTIQVMGKTLGKGQEFSDEVGAMIEAPGFLPGYSGYQNLKFLAAIRKKIGEPEIKNAMTRVGLDWKSKKKVGKYSMGMKQRLSFAQAIMENPGILLLDEPTNGMDEKSVRDTRELLNELRNQGKLIIITSHIKEDIQLLCDVVYKMDQGHLVRQEKD